MERVLQDQPVEKATQLWLISERAGLAQGKASGGVTAGRRKLQEGVPVGESAKTFRPYSLAQGILLPPDLRDWVPAGHLAHLISDLVEDSLDLSRIYGAYGELRGAPPYDPRLLTKLLLYGYATGVFSSRRIERAVHESIPFRYLAGNQLPDHKTISEFRRIHLAALMGLFDQVLEICRRAGLVELGHVALDGTKIKANANKHKAMSYAGMQEREPKYEQVVREWLARAEAEDQAEDRLYGKDRRGDELPEEFQHAESRLRKLREAKAALEREAREAAATAAAEKAQAAQLPADEVQARADAAAQDAVPKPKAQRNFTDPESRIMVNGDKAFIQGYNCQTAVDDTDHQVIVARGVSNQAADNPLLLPMVVAVAWSTGEIPQCISADAGYGAAANVLALEAVGIDAYLAQGREGRYRYGETVADEPSPGTLSAQQRMAEKLRSEPGHAVYKRRKHVVEPPYGFIKQSLGFRQFLLRGLEKANGEWSLVTTAYNLTRLHASGRAGLAANT